MTIPFHHSVVCPTLIGRNAELTALQDCLEATARGQGGVVLLCGEAGIGKSRLVAELQRSAQTHVFQLLNGQCFPTDRTCPYAPLLDLVATFLAPLSPSQIATALGSSALALVPLLPEQVLHLPELASLSPLFSLDPEQEQHRLFTALADVFMRATTSRPLLLVIEDLHWSDENTLEFLLFFARKTAGQRLLVLLTYRNDEIHQRLRFVLAQFDRERQRREVVLEPLSRANTETFLLTILQGSRSLPAGMLDALFDLTEGNPFFLEEVIKALIVAGELVEREEGWRWKRADTWHIPLSLHNAVELRLTRLSKDARQVLQLAAVAGQLGQVVSSTSYLSRGQAHEILGDFEQAQADYERALGAFRQEHQGRLEWQSLQNLGFLWTSRDYQRAGAYFQQAVELAIQLGDARLHAQSLNRLGNWLLNTGQIAEAFATHHEALALFEAQHDQSGMAETLDLLGAVYHLEGDSVNAALMYGRAIELLRAVGNRSVLCSCLTMRATVACPWGGDTSCTINWSLAECERDLAEALQLAHELEWAAGVASVEIFYGGMLASFGRLGAGLAHGQQGLHLAMEMQHQQWVAGAHYTLASNYLSLLAPEQALFHAEVGLEAARALGSAIWIINLKADQIQAYTALSQPEMAEAALQEVQPRAENPRQVAERLLLLVWAELALVQQQPELALERCEQLLSTAPQRAGETEERVIPRLWKCQGEALAALGRTEEAIQVLEEARRGAILQQYLPLLWQIDRALGQAYQRQSRLEEAQQAFASARQGIALLSESIEDPILCEHFEQTAYATLPKEKPVSPRRATADEYGGLTERERVVATLIGQGKSNAEMAALLVVSRRTVETYVSRVLSKLGLTSRSQIALWTRDNGLTSREP